MKKAKFSVLAFVLLIAVLLSACNGKADDDSTSREAVDSMAEQTNTEDISNGNDNASTGSTAIVTETEEDLKRWIKTGAVEWHLKNEDPNKNEIYYPTLILDEKAYLFPYKLMEEKEEKFHIEPMGNHTLTYSSRVKIGDDLIGFWFLINAYKTDTSKGSNEGLKAFLSIDLYNKYNFKKYTVKNTDYYVDEEKKQLYFFYEYSICKSSSGSRMVNCIYNQQRLCT